MVVADDYVTTEAGTGMVHQAPAFGEDDYRILQGGGHRGVCGAGDAERHLHR